MLAKTSGQKVLKQLNKAGYGAYFVGGMVRDTLLNRKLADVDIATGATPEVVLDLFDQTIVTGLQHGTVTVVIDGEQIEVTTFRLDGQYLDHRRPDRVVFTRSLLEDLARRDFTINAMAQGLDGELIDPFNGQVDLKANLIRAVGDDPKARFKEDALRILRGIRFVAKLGFDVEKKTLEAMKACRNLLANLSLERIRKELEGIIEGEYRAKAFEIMLSGQLFDAIPYFLGLGNYEIKTLAKVDVFKLMILMATCTCGDVKGFFDNFPLTRDEKKLIKDFDRAHLEFKEVERDVLIHYYFGSETARLIKKYHHLKKNDVTFTFDPPRLPIASRSDLAIQPDEVIRRSGNLSGAWVGRLFTEMEEAVVLGKIENNCHSLAAFIKERGIFDEKED